MKKLDLATIDFDKLNGLVPAIIQHAKSLEVLMLGFMNSDALKKTLATNRVTFYSRTKKRLWTKGETSNNYLEVVSIEVDCDRDTLLIKAQPQGAVCHLQRDTCFGDYTMHPYRLLELLLQRQQSMPANSYSSYLFSKGTAAILAKIAEESSEVIKAVKYEGQQRTIEESCDLIYHLLVLLVDQGISIDDIVKELQRRHQKDH